jgi:hypothetical protein
MPRRSSIILPQRNGTIDSNLNILRKNYEMVWSSAHWQRDNQLRLDKNEADDIINKIK